MGMQIQMAFMRLRPTTIRVPISVVVTINIVFALAVILGLGVATGWGNGWDGMVIHVVCMCVLGGCLLIEIGVRAKKYRYIIKKRFPIPLEESKASFHFFNTKFIFCAPSTRNNNGAPFFHLFFLPNSFRQ